MNQYAGDSNNDKESSENVIDTPIKLRNLEHERELFDWDPGFCLNVPSFDSRNRPFIRSRTSDLHTTGSVHTIDCRGVSGGSAIQQKKTAGYAWISLDFIEAVKTYYPAFKKTVRGGGWLGSRVVFDMDNHAYTVLRIELNDGSEKNVLIYSRDYCRTWTLYDLPEGNIFIEHSADQSLIPEPPAILFVEKRADHPARWANLNVLSLIVPEKTEEGLLLGGPITLSEDCLGICKHSGGSLQAVTKKGLTWVVWVEVTDREELTGSPTYISVYDRRTGILGQKTFLALAEPKNNVHCTPGICIDYDGFLHVVTGAHNRSFYYSKSKEPYNAAAGWSEPQPVLTAGWWRDSVEDQEGRQTYVSLVCDRENTLHLVFRETQKAYNGYFKTGQDYKALSYQRRIEGASWEEADLLVVPPSTGYSNYYQKLAIDLQGRIYLSYSYWNDSEEYKALGGRYNFRSMLFSDDGGDTWSHAKSSNLIEGILP